MIIIADLHLHSKYSRAVSQKMNLKEINLWAEKKGIHLVGTADWTHPLWFREIQNNLEEIRKGIFSLKDKKDVFSFPWFILSVEVANIYTQKGKQHRIHNLILSPSLTSAEKFIKYLEKKSINLLSDGRPILGFSSKELLKILLDIDENFFLIPCHVWTPWFSLYGSKSGFDSIQECFGDMEKYIFAIETGLSSDPLMNWQIEELDNRTIVSFSDAHSGSKLGREATVLVYTSASSYFDFFDIIKAFKKDATGKLKIGYTIEFFPEEGKYHWNGHRLCNVRYSPRQLKEKGVICPVCQKPLTVGVESRVLKLAKRIIEEKDLLFLKNSSDVVFVYDKEKKRTPFVSLVPLLEILSEIYLSEKKAEKEYERLVTSFDKEFNILLKRSYEEIEQAGGKKLKEAIRIVRNRQVFVEPGYDGVFGKVSVFKNHDQSSKNLEQQTLF